tara:strand:+ start:45 stop:260 length:216 start_codon:yes stop_codon:yes gene_type:complete
MPFEVIHFKEGHNKEEYPHFMLKKLTTGKIVKGKHYKTRISAINAAKVMMRYNKEVPIVKGNKILDKNKLK